VEYGTEIQNIGMNEMFLLKTLRKNKKEHTCLNKAKNRE